MKIMIVAVNAKYIHSNPAVYSLYRYAQLYQENLLLREFTVNQSRDEIMKEIYLQHPEVICFSCYIWNISLIRSLAAQLKKVLPDTDIWYGGPEVSYDAAEVLEQQSFLCGVMKGEGERIFLELVRYYHQKCSSLDQIAGICWRDKEGHIRDNPLPEAMNMDDIPFPYDGLEQFMHRIIYYESSRGCPFSCSYCLSSVDRRLRFRSLELVMAELAFFLKRQVRQVKFVDRSFNCDHQRTKAIWQFIKANDNGITNFHFEIAADLLTDDELEIIRTMRPGLIQLEIGVQSINPKTLAIIRRQMNFEKLSSNVRKIAVAGNIHQHLDLIAGLPYEDYNSFKASFQAVYELQPQQLQLGFLKVLKGSHMHQQAAAYGCLYQDREPYEVLQTNWLSYDEILKLKQVEEMVEIYYNSGQYLKTIPVLTGLFPAPFDFYEALGAFYERKGYSRISHSRMRRYDILLEFIAACNTAEPGFYKELLLFDLYAREKLKSRPAWADPQPQYQEQKRRFYHREQETYQYLSSYRGYDEKQLSKMTHLEVFQWNVLAGKQQRVQQLILFDYRSRDPLTNSARYQIITEEG